MERDYSSVYHIKDFIMSDVAPKYFDVAKTGSLNAGLLGFTTDVAATVTEDAFNGITTLTKEMFPNQAQIPETLYNFASIMQVNNLLATPAVAPMALFIKVSDVLNRGEKRESQVIFKLDSSLIVDIESKQFMPDYDIVITAKPSFNGEYVYSVQYDMTERNSISSVINPYILSKQIFIDKTQYIVFSIDMHQVNRFENFTNISSADQVNVPTISFEFNGQLAGFDVFYRPAGETTYQLLEKRLTNSAPTLTPFCYYKIKDTDRVDVTFSTRDNYFRPDFNSDILIRFNTTTGSEGVFPKYNAANTVVYVESSKYAYNNGVVLYALPQSGSYGGQDALTMEELRRIIIEKYSTSGAYNIENDLQLYFSRFDNRENNRVRFIKTRDDIMERLYTAFSLFKAQSGDFYQTNTLFANFVNSDFDVEYDQSDTFILKAGHVFKYDGDAQDRVVKTTKRVTDLTKPVAGDFMYTNPFLMSVVKVQGIVGYYLNSINERLVLDYNYVNSNSFSQFICNEIYIKRNAIIGEDAYHIEIELMEASVPDKPIVVNGVYTGALKVALMFEDGGVETGFVEMQYASYDSTTKLYKFTADLTTNDFMTLNQKMQFENIVDMATMVSGKKLLPMFDAILNIHVFADTTTRVPHKYDRIPQLASMTHTNTYTTFTNRATFILPMNIMRSTLKYFGEQGSPLYTTQIASIPFIEAFTMKDVNKLEHFISLITTQYRYMMDIIDRVNNSYGVDMKFYNTYGRSKNFSIGEAGQKLNRTNLKLAVKIIPTVGTNDDELIRNLKLRIKGYVEDANSFKDGTMVEGYNAIYLSNLIQIIENEFPNVKYLRNMTINEYDASIQAVENLGVQLEKLTTLERRYFVPEYLTIRLEDIQIDIIRQNESIQ